MTRALQILRTLGPIDMKGIRRDSALSWMIIIPIISSLVMRWGLPPLNRSLIVRYGFDLRPYYPVLAAYFIVIMSPIVFSVLVGFLLLDEKDDNTLTALQITPMSINSYLAYRVVVPVILTVVLMFLIFPLSNLGSLIPKEILITALAAAPMSPMFALFLASQAQNKVQGFALIKLTGFLLFSPIFAFFINSPWEYLFGLLPTYWPMKVYWTLEAGGPYTWIYASAAVIYQSLLTWLFIRRFNKKITS
jgi:fluoroquinolone transport system permease protein